MIMLAMPEASEAEVLMTTLPLPLTLEKYFGAQEILQRPLVFQLQVPTPSQPHKVYAAKPKQSLLPSLAAILREIHLAQAVK